MFNRNRNIDIDPNYYYYQQGMQQPPYPPQKPSVVDGYMHGIFAVIKIFVVIWIISTIYGVLLAEGDSWNQKALNYFEQQRVIYQQQVQKVLEEQNNSK